ncbi:MAG TPA: cyclic nucleotide-binding domain-containing protein [Actinomycetota bacterium]|nr:cyclic nucleotide-binding domain-containing protein [Actinomycetota bacterium]
MPNERVEMLRSVPLFNGLSRRQVAQILKLGREMEFSPGETIVEHGLQAMDFYLIMNGQAKLRVPGRRARTLGPGDYFGEISVLDGGRRTATITAENRVWALRLDRSRFIPLLDRHGSIARKILVEMCARLRAAEGERST